MPGPGWHVAGLALTSISVGTTAPGRCRWELAGWEGWWGTRLETRVLGRLLVLEAEAWILG